MKETAALKEWASVIDALESGLQIVVLRKGGIAEETGEFEMASRSFYLFPSYEHQKPELLKPEHRHLVENSKRGYDPGAGAVTVKIYAEAVDDLLLSTEAELHSIYGCHIWTEAFADQRLRWKRKDPLHALLLRIYRLDEPVSVAVEPSYYGCKSWIALPIAPDLPKKPVLSDAAFAARMDEIRAAVQKS